MKFPCSVLFLLCAALPAAARPPDGGNPFGQNVMNPDISVIGEVGFANVNYTDKTAGQLTFPGYLSGANRDGKSRGINFNYLEIGLQAAVDPYFDFFAVVTGDPGGIGVEEMYVNTRALPWGFGLRVGKLSSAFGRFNPMHKHVWDFYDAPLVYEAFMGGEGLKDLGGRITWTAPVDFLLQLNIEVFQGQLDGNPTFNANGMEMTSAAGTRFIVPDAAVPCLIAGSLKTSFDVGDHVFLLGGSVMTGPNTQRLQSSDPASDRAFLSDRAWLYGADVTYKYLMDSYRSLTVQGEFLRRNIDGYAWSATMDHLRGWNRVQSGFYLQAVWRFDRDGRWRVGARYDLLAENQLNGSSIEGHYNLPRYTGMLEFNPTEFSRLRLQYNFDRSKYYNPDGMKDLQEILFQLTFAVGPHGAHSF